MTQRFYSHGKLLLTGEYVVLDGALSLAVPTKRGQILEVTPLETSQITWQSFLENDTLWIDETFKLPLEKTLDSEDTVLIRLHHILREVQRLNPNIFKKGVSFKSRLEFDKSWGLGSSSTLITNIAQWAVISPYELLENTFGGSGYDIACAAAQGPISYQIINSLPQNKKVVFNPNFTEELFFVYLNRKQNSRESIQHYRKATTNNVETAIQKISKLTEAIISCDSITVFEDLMEQHESIIASIIKTPTIKEQLFKDYPRCIKSLGGWGGDFILATGGAQERTYFQNKGFNTIIPYREMVL